ncbi:MAG: helix-turn-helix transcriptional regulator [Phycisphaerales bacterium JB065]
MERTPQEPNRSSSAAPPALEGSRGRITEPKPDPRTLKARPLSRPREECPKPADPVEGFVVRESEMPWIADVLEELTPRQRDVLLECCSGGSSEEIARRMGVSESTLQNHLHAMRLRLGVTGRDRLARMVGVRLIAGHRTRMERGAS